MKGEGPFGPTSALTRAECMRRHRQRRRRLGLVELHIWAHPADRAALQQLAQQLREARGIDIRSAPVIDVLRTGGYDVSGIE